jgi:hypothetical protein
MSKNFKVALVAIAANEAAYMAQFVYHHLRMGFSPIILLTNNSEDDTAVMAAQMAARLPEVIHIDADPWREVWPINEFQKRAYQLALHMIDGMQVKPDYVMFLDIDEFWVPLTGDTTVSAYINRHDAPDTMMFNWVVPDKDDAPFSQAFLLDFVGSPHNHLKTIWRYGVSITHINPHNVTSEDLRTEIVVSGLPLVGRHATNRHPDHPGDAMILHQMFRSMPEYVATLERGNPIDNLLFKTNRWGFRRFQVELKPINISIHPDLCRHWRTDFPQWLEETGLTLMLVAGRASVVSRCERGLNTFLLLSDEDLEIYAKVFINVDFDAVQGFVSQALSDPVRHLHRIP